MNRRRADLRSAGAVSWGIRGFTLIELMVVVAIIMMAMGVMTPTLIDFFRNQKLKSVRTHFSGAFNIARLMAITEGTPVRVVFYREGLRIYHVRNGAFRKEEEFTPESAPGSLQGISFELRFCKQQNSDLIAYRDWEKSQPYLNAPLGTPDAGLCSVDGLVAVEFQRDGTIVWKKGDDIPSNLFTRKPIEDADIIVRQLGNAEQLFIDLRKTGQVRTMFDQSKEDRREKP